VRRKRRRVSQHKSALFIRLICGIVIPIVLSTLVASAFSFSTEQKKRLNIALRAHQTDRHKRKEISVALSFISSFQFTIALRSCSSSNRKSRLEGGEVTSGQFYSACARIQAL
jgi:hypothetical protein